MFIFQIWMVHKICKWAQEQQTNLKISENIRAITNQNPKRASTMLLYYWIHSKITNTEPSIYALKSNQNNCLFSITGYNFHQFTCTNIIHSTEYPKPIDHHSPHHWRDIDGSIMNPMIDQIVTIAALIETNKENPRQSTMSTSQ